MSESEAKPASPVPNVCTQGCNSIITVQCPTLQVTSRMLRSPSHESVTTDISLFSVSSIASELRGANRLVTFKSYSDVQLAGRGPSPKPDRQIQGNRWVNIHWPIHEICHVQSRIKIMDLLYADILYSSKTIRNGSSLPMYFQLLVWMNLYLSIWRTRWIHLTHIRIQDSPCNWNY